MRQNRPSARQPDSKSTQRRRLLAGMLAAIQRDGYSGATVTNVIARAGVSRPTFYDYFADKDDCVLALYRDISRQLLAQIAQVVNDSPPEQALNAVVRYLAKHAEAKPAEARFLASDALAGGPRVLEERAHTIGEISNGVRETEASAPPQALAPDLPTQAVVGASHALIAQRMRRGERDLTQLTKELTRWLTSYAQPIGKHRWSMLAPGPRPQSFRRLSELLEDPRASERSGSRHSKLNQSRRSRILCATAESAAQSGYAATTITAITSRARLHKPFFYDHFRDKRQALLTVHELAWQESMAIGAIAYFAVRRWPERVWHCLLATSQFYAAYPALAHVGYVETQALGPSAIQRVEETRHVFTTLLCADSGNLGRLSNVTTAEAISAAIFELVHDQVRQKCTEKLPRFAYHAAYLALAPFLGVPAANRFVLQKLKSASRESTPTECTR